MIVKCIDNRDLECYLTLGNKYISSLKLKNFIVIKADTGEKITCSKFRFREIEG